MIICHHSLLWRADMHHPNQTEQNRAQKFIVSVPAKAMLFGEYGVLRGGPAAVFVFSKFCMTLEFSLTRCAQPDDAFCELQSDFFAQPVRLAVSEIERSASSQGESEARNLACYLSGFGEFLNDKQLSVRVVQSFSPAFGFGSSSALLSAFQIALSQLSGGTALTPDYWHRIYRALILLQGKGSGYDIAAQSWSAAGAHSHVDALLGFSNTDLSRRSLQPVLRPIDMAREEMAQLGCFVQTGVRSDTRAVLNQQPAKPNEFYEKQAEWAQKFIDKPSSAHAAQLCRESSLWARRHGLLPETNDLRAFTDACDAQQIAWKTMGAGHGDCLWVMAPRARIDEIIRLTGVKSPAVCFAFAEGA
ncbi:MAG: hypothetical protein RLZZ488_2154 [Pseudomonadota bacterium]|jgi:mevalonate kinase